MLNIQNKFLQPGSTTVIGGMDLCSTLLSLFKLAKYYKFNQGLCKNKVDLKL